MDQFLNKVFWGDALRLLRRLPTHSIDACITDAMYGTAKNCRYDWGPDPAKGNPEQHWMYHEPIYRECLRVLKPDGILAWGQGCKFLSCFDDWFGPHRVWSPLCRALGLSLNFHPNTWVVQTREGHPIEHPNKMVVYVDRKGLVPFKKVHPCPKPIEEMAFMIELLTKPGQIVLDCFCGTPCV